ncbi:MAG: hypothetical protein A2X22_12320 [Bacteroidetes bacterium GWF2_49_14]|nr:MAG: hypothetical protein A2X22_12320 [Bacteroidetes bacterium GWF2_49_14]HBB91249.1 hypothetical protein [Bacteroidales bacterium]
MKKKFTILCQIISLLYVAICLVVLFKTQDRSNSDYARAKKCNTESVNEPIERVHSGSVRMLSN